MKRIKYKDNLDLADKIVKKMNDDIEFFKAMHIAMFNNETR